MTHRIKYLIAGVVVAATLGMTAVPASATSMTTVMNTVDDLVDDLHDISTAGEDLDAEAMGDACGSMSVNATVALSYSRPRVMPKVAWRHVRQSWRYMSEAGDLCETGADSYDADMIGEAADLIELADAEVSLALDLM